jgi:hypothetical protein
MSLGSHLFSRSLADEHKNEFTWWHNYCTRDLVIDPCTSIEGVVVSNVVMSSLGLAGASLLCSAVRNPAPLILSTARSVSPFDWIAFISPLRCGYVGVLLPLLRCRWWKDSLKFSSCLLPVPLDLLLGVFPCCAASSLFPRSEAFRDLFIALVCGDFWLASSCCIAEVNSLCLCFCIVLRFVTRFQWLIAKWSWPS